MAEFEPEVCETLDVPKGKKNPYKNLVVKRTGWKTIRIFVSSTFRDFHREREVLVKEVFPDLRAWCENRRLHLVECDLRWGVPKDSTTESTLRTCLGEIDRCYQDNIMPFFINMTSERIGWIPSSGDVPHNLVEEYKWIFGLSITEMEIVHGAYRKDNPNSLFLIRDDSFLSTVPDEYKQVFIDENPVAPEKLKVLKQMIDDRFPKTRVIKYKCDFNKFDEDTKRVHLNVDDVFKQSVFRFFKDRISVQYPLIDTQTDIYQQMLEGQESFMKSKADAVLGRGDVLAKIQDYINGNGPDVPLLLLGGPGTGKSSIMAKAVDTALTAAIEQKIPGGGGKPWNVFYHFVGALPGSTTLQTTLQRLLKEMNLVTEKTMPSDMETIVQMTCSALNVTTTAPTIILIDAVNQFDKENHAELLTWVPRKLGPNIRCVFAMINDTPPHVALTGREAKPAEIIVNPLNMEIRKDIVREYLGKFNKKLDGDQMISLLCKESSSNPLWLAVACEELRVYGEFRKINDKINTLADGLLELLQQVLSRFEEEGGGHLMVATLCLLEVSSTGLLEAELLQLLADEENLMPGTVQEKGSKEESEKGKKREELQILPAYKWAAVYRSLRPFLRPFGDSGEGRLDFYHRSLSKAVRKKYLKTEDAERSTPLYKWWHSKLADFFSRTENIKRKLEEYPVHLLYLKDTDRLEDFLGDFRVFDELYDRDYSPKLILYWKEIGTQRMMEVYSEQLRKIEDKNNLSQRCEMVTRSLTQLGQFDAAKDLGKQALEIEEKELGARPERMGDLYSMMANILSEKLKTFQYIDPAQTPMEWEALCYTRDALKVYQQLAPTNQKYKILLAKQMIKMSFSMMSWMDVSPDTEEYDLTATEAETQGRDIIESAIHLIENELHDKSCLPEAYMTKACFFRFRKTSEEIKWYIKADEKAEELFGGYHIICGRINLNTGIAYEDKRVYKMAWEFFKRSFEIFYQILGPDHPMTQRLWSTLYQPVYKLISEQKKYELLPLPPGVKPE